MSQIFPIKLIKKTFDKKNHAEESGFKKRRCEFLSVSVGLFWCRMEHWAERKTQFMNKFTSDKELSRYYLYG